MKQTPVIAVDLSQAADFLLQQAFTGTDLVLERAGTAVAAEHKLTGAAPHTLVVVLENRKPITRAQPYETLLATVRAAGIPIMLLCNEPLLQAKRDALGIWLRVLEPPIYPQRLLREIKQFAWRDETRYVMRHPGRRAHGFTVVLVAPPSAAGEGPKRLRAWFCEQGNDVLEFADIDTAAAAVSGKQDDVLVFHFMQDRYGENTESAEKILRRLHADAYVPVLAPEAMRASTVYPLVSAGAMAVLPNSLPDNDLQDIYASLRFLPRRSGTDTHA